MKIIFLTNSTKSVFVDDEDYEYLNQWKWYERDGYACRYHYNTEDDRRSPGEGCSWGMVQEMYGKVLHDHRDRNPLNNQRHNLRRCTQQQNSCNSGKKKTKRSSQYKGVYKFKGASKYIARIFIEGKNRTIGTFIEEVEAAQAYNQIAAHFWGEFAYLNPVPPSDKDFLKGYLAILHYQPLSAEEVLKARRKNGLKYYYAKKQRDKNKA